MKALDSQLLSKFLQKVVTELRGEWLLVGGALLPAVGLNIRATVDIDIVGLGPAEANQSLELMKISESLGLAVESVNQAAAYFVNKIGYTKKDLLILRQGKYATIYRPSVILYWRLKVLRMTEADTLDCQHYLNYCVAQEDRVDLASLKIVLNSALKNTNETEKRFRLETLLKLISF